MDGRAIEDPRYEPMAEKLKKTCNELAAWFD